MMKFLCAMLACVCSFGHAQAEVLAGAPAGTALDTPPDAMSPQSERGRIQAERDRIEARFASEQVACYQKFAVTDCVGGARVVRREALADLRRQEVSLNAAEAKRRGAEQLSRTEDKSSLQAQLDAANRRADALAAQQQRQASADDRAAAKAAAGLTTDSRVTQEVERAAKRDQAQAERAAKANAAALERKKYADKQKQAQERAQERRKRLAGQSPSTAKPLDSAAEKVP